MSVPKHNVCLIDDDKIYQFTARKILESTGLAKNILSFYNGSEAIGFLKESGNGDQERLPDVIFLDINMPVMDGLEATEKIRKFDKSIPITDLTAAVLPEEKENYYKIGIDAIV